MRKIPKKNYLLLTIVVIITVALVFYIDEWIKTYKFMKMTDSPLTQYLSVVNNKELSLAISESNQIILYVGYNYNEDVRLFEKKLLKEIRNSNLTEYVIYYDVTQELAGKKYLKTLKGHFSDLEVKINTAPLLIYIKNGVAVDIIDSSDDLINIEDFKYLIEQYEINN